MRIYSKEFEDRSDVCMVRAEARCWDAAAAVLPPTTAGDQPRKLSVSAVLSAFRPVGLEKSSLSNRQFLWITAGSLKWPGAIDRGMRSLHG
ncbi:hypothetical protein [Streptomyces sp. NPDC056227]|uniref:hypothetical protein n=1 Tax=Streptomyces sp. NPDC056227 TaxID=3345753 RepID=UPI0035E041E8